MRQMVDPCVALQGVGKRFAEQWVLRDLSFSCPAGETTAIVGESGSGKSTLLQLINAVYLPDAGSIEVFGRPPPTSDTAHYRRGIGYAVQGAGLFPHMTVQRNVTLLAKLEGWSEVDTAARFGELLGLMGLDESLANRYPNQLSGGQQQRVGLCRALMLKPRMLLLDEPFSAVDPITRLGLHEQFLKLRLVEKVSTLLVTHDMREARKLSNHLVILREGRVIQQGVTRDVIGAPANDYVKGLLESLE
jgi:osmoprotectant transport system ATP-binding protein